MLQKWGGQTGTTDDNADAWFIGYTPQLLAGSWVGFEYTFMHNQGDGSRIARPIAEYFFQKVLADKKLGIEKDAKFIKPAELEEGPNNADIIISEQDPVPGAEGVDQGTVTEEDYQLNNNEYISPESIPVKEDNMPAKRDSIVNTPVKKETENKPIGSAQEDPEKKKVCSKDSLTAKINLFIHTGSGT